MLKKKYVIFAIFLIFVLALLNYQSTQGISPFPKFLLYPLKLLEQGGSAVLRTAGNVVNTYIMIVGKEAENNGLRERIDELEKEKNRFVEIEKENIRLKNILELKSKQPDYITAAVIFSRDPSNWFQVFWINKGKSSGIGKDMVAVTQKGPVGRIDRILDEESSIVLITDVNSSVAVRLQSSRVEGILEGRGDDRCTLKYVSKEIDVKIGEEVVTSGMDNIYPKGLLIGRVTAITKEGGELFQVIEVDPSQDLNVVEEVTILKK
ncbi:MAG: hypothetical protein AMK70_06385 [Nitrospira bacterium SG8_35_1]|nr:MAG: hypothetical protein AMK70_06385 [Nitrospira bacterium SG8_35_1]